MPTTRTCRCSTRCATSSALHGLHFGCGLAQCGACTVHYYGEALRCCVMPVSAVAGAEVVTLEGLGTPDKPHPLQQAFIDEQAAQCGYCINGMIMQAAAFLATTKRPTEDQVRQALAANLCKCGTHVRIVRAVMRASEKMALIAWDLASPIDGLPTRISEAR